MRPDTVYLVITGFSNDRYRFNIVSLKVYSVTPGVELTVDPQEVTITKNESAEFDVTVVPTHNFTGNVTIYLIHKDAGNRFWNDYTLVLEVEDTEILKLVIVNITHSGVFNFTIKAHVPNFNTESEVKVIVNEPIPPDEPVENGEEIGDEGLTVTQSLIIVAIGLIIIVLVIVVFSRRPKKDNEDVHTKEGPGERTMKK
jgi:hypothetical protein